MNGEKDLAGDGECSRTKTSKPRFSHLNSQTQDEKTGRFDKGVDFLSVRSNNHDGFSSKSSPRSGNELTLSYLCENRELSGKIAESLGQKGKEVVTFSENSSYDEKWIERDFFNLRETGPNSSKRKAHDDVKEEEDVEEEKKNNKIETLNLSLALPDVSLSLTASNAVKRPRVTANSERTTTSFSNDFTATAPSMSYSYSHPFSHNISCSMTRNSTDFDCSTGKDDHIWCAGEGTNGSVHSRFRPIGDGVLLAGNPIFAKPSSSSDYSFFPSELPARPGMEVAISGDSRKKLPNTEENDAVRSERVLYDIVSKSISSVALIIQGMADETLESAKEYLRNLIDSPEKKEKLIVLSVTGKSSNKRKIQRD